MAFDIGHINGKLESALPFLQGGVDVVKGAMHDDNEEVGDGLANLGLDLLANATGTGAFKSVADLGLETAGLKSSGHYLKYLMMPGMALQDAQARDRKAETIATGQALAQNHAILPRALQSYVGVPDAELTNGVRSASDMMAALHGHLPAAAPAAAPRQTPSTVENIERTAEMVAPARDHRATFNHLFGE